MDCIAKISEQYNGSISLYPPCKKEISESLPRELHSILCISDGIAETMFLPNTKESITIGWIVYPYDMILEQTAFYAETYGIKGTVFSDDGAGCPYIIKPDGAITCFNGIEGEEFQTADSLSAFFQ